MKWRCIWWGGWLAIGLAWSGPARPVFRLAAPASGTNLLRNAGFEQASAGRFSDWSVAPQGCRVAAAPVVVRGWSRAEGVDGSPDRDYSLYVDIIYNDGTPLWGRTANFQCGTHDWEQREILITPEKPIRTLSFYCLVRNHAGKVWFDEVEVEDAGASGAALWFQGVSVEPGPGTNAPGGSLQVVETGDGLRLAWAGQRITSLKLDGQELSGGAPGGFLARDVAANSDIYGFAEGACPELDLRLEASVTAHPDHLALAGRVLDTRGGDRAISWLLALPLEAAGWAWGDDIQQSRRIAGRSEYSREAEAECGLGGLSVYPMGAVWNDRWGLALGLDMGQPAVFRIVYHAGTRQLFLACDFGLAPETSRFPGGALFRLVIHRFDPRWGFRAAWQKYASLFPAYLNSGSIYPKPGTRNSRSIDIRTVPVRLRTSAATRLGRANTSVAGVNQTLVAAEVTRRI